MTLVQRMSRHAEGQDWCMRHADPRPTREAVWEAVLGQRERAVRVALARGAQPQDVDDVVHEAMARVAAMPQVDLARVGPLLSTVVSNLIVDGHRRRTAADKALLRLRADRAVEPAADDDVCDAAEARWLDRQIPFLPAQDARVLRLRAQGLTRRQAAASLGITDKAAEGAFSRARVQMYAIWRTTAALFGIGWVRQLRHGRLTVPAGGSAAFAAVATVLLLVPAAPSVPAPPNGGALATEARSAGPTPQRHALESAAARPVTSTPAARPRIGPGPAAGSSGSAGPRPRRVVGTRPLSGTAGVSGGAVSVEEQEPDQSLGESVQQCVDEGVTVTLSEIGC